MGLDCMLSLQECCILFILMVSHLNDWHSGRYFALKSLSIVAGVDSNPHFLHQQDQRFLSQQQFVVREILVWELEWKQNLQHLFSSSWNNLCGIHVFSTMLLLPKIGRWNLLLCHGWIFKIPPSLLLFNKCEWTAKNHHELEESFLC